MTMKCSEGARMERPSDAAVIESPLGYANVQDDSPSFLPALVRSWRAIAISGLICATTAFASSFLMTRVYRSEVLAIPVTEEAPGAGGLASLAAQFGGLAGLAGIELGTGGDRKREALAILRSRGFIRAFIEQNSLMPEILDDRWDQDKRAWRRPIFGEAPTINDAIERFSRQVLRVDEDRLSGVVTVAIEWRDPVAAAKWANDLVSRVNSDLQSRDLADAERNIRYLTEQANTTTMVTLREALYRVLEKQLSRQMFAKGRDQYALKVIDVATTSDRTNFVRPKRVMMAVLGLFLGLAIAYAGALVGSLRHRSQLRGDA